MVDEFMVCVDRIIIATTCFGDSHNSLLTDVVVDVTSNVEIINSRMSDEITSSGGGDGNGECCSKGCVRECRICQEEDDENDMEAPCACNGTLKFAHRKCIQKWCNKKGDITCEICNKVFSPNYTLPPARSNPDVMAIDIRQAWGPDMDIRNPHFLAFAAAERQFLQSEYDDYSIASSGSLACFLYVAIIVIDATLADTPNFDGHKGLRNGAGLIYILQFSDFTSSAGGFPPPLLCNGSDMVHDTMPTKEADVLMQIQARFNFCPGTSFLENVVEVLVKA
ncbi:hypothetical protein RND71_032072 [Anisodus tanguticus]|uniref:RING-CH-type domain-containing protein n=1 Tax=Anisodus tanguticus TaxID=243964 RepID=A0AAE1REH4_9SOLA|nr:hypothetical protein RND71_032072 [Anisodus tanguticus]